MTTSDQQPRGLTASARPSTLAHVKAKQIKEAERTRLRYERQVDCRLSSVYRSTTTDNRLA